MKVERIMKAYTDIEQSKKLAEILPLETADMLFQLGEDKYADSIRVPLTKEHWEQMMPDINPCWSLVTLLNYLREIDFFPEIDADEHSVTMSINYYDKEAESLLAPIHNIKIKAEGFIDACYAMITKLREREVL